MAVIDRMLTIKSGGLLPVDEQAIKNAKGYSEREYALTEDTEGGE